VLSEPVHLGTDRLRERPLAYVAPAEDDLNVVMVEGIFACPMVGKKFGARCGRSRRMLRAQSVPRGRSQGALEASRERPYWPRSPPCTTAACKSVSTAALVIGEYMTPAHR
jgi:hypothetical protein